DRGGRRLGEHAPRCGGRIDLLRGQRLHPRQDDLQRLCAGDGVGHGGITIIAAVRALYFGTYDRDHPRNVNAIAAMRDAGVEVVERNAAVHGAGVRGAASVLGAETRLLRPRGDDFDLVIVGYPGHFDVPQARRLARRKPLVFDAVLSLEDELVVMRRRFRPRSTAATLLRAVDRRALRLPDLVVCGTEAEARHLGSLGGSHVASVFLGADESLYRHPWSPT